MIICPTCNRECDDIKYTGLDGCGDPMWGCPDCQAKATEDDRMDQVLAYLKAKRDDRVLQIDAYGSLCARLSHIRARLDVINIEKALSNPITIVFDRRDQYGNNSKQLAFPDAALAPCIAILRAALMDEERDVLKEMETFAAKHTDCNTKEDN